MKVDDRPVLVESVREQPSGRRSKLLGGARRARDPERRRLPLQFRGKEHATAAAVRCVAQAHRRLAPAANHQMVARRSLHPGSAPVRWRDVAIAPTHTSGHRHCSNSEVDASGDTSAEGDGCSGWGAAAGVVRTHAGFGVASRDLRFIQEPWETLGGGDEGCVARGVLSREPRCDSGGVL